MKKIFNYSFLVLASIFCLAFSTTPADPGIIGNWEAPKNGFAAMLYFYNDGYFSSIIGGAKVDGRKYMMGNMAYSMIYETNPKTTPRQIDLIYMETVSQKEISRCKCIYELQGTNKLRIRLNEAGAERPKDFGSTPESGTMELEKTE